MDIRKSLGLSQKEFADLIGMTRRQIAEMETGSNPTLDTMNRIGKLFGFTVGFVPKDDDPANDHPQSLKR